MRFSHTLWNKGALFHWLSGQREFSFRISGAQTPITNTNADPQLGLAMGQGRKKRNKIIILLYCPGLLSQTAV